LNSDQLGGRKEDERMTASIGLLEKRATKMGAWIKTGSRLCAKGTGSVFLQNGTPTYHNTHWRNIENHKMFIYAAKPEILYQQV
jgi:hypothetical protein